MTDVAYTNNKECVVCLLINLKIQIQQTDNNSVQLASVAQDRYNLVNSVTFVIEYF